jgi:hypothetical protein
LVLKLLFVLQIFGELLQCTQCASCKKRKLGGTPEEAFEEEMRKLANSIMLPHIIAFFTHLFEGLGCLSAFQSSTKAQFLPPGTIPILLWKSYSIAMALWKSYSIAMASETKQAINGWKFASAICH